MVELDAQASSGAAGAAAPPAAADPDGGAAYGAIASAAASEEAAGDESEVSGDDALCVRLKLLDERVVEVAAARSMSIANFRVAVAHATQVPVYRQRLIYRGKLLKDGTVLAAYDIRDGHTVHVVAKPTASAVAAAAVASTATSSSAAVTAASRQQHDDDEVVSNAIRRNREYMRRLMSDEDELSREAGSEGLETPPVRAQPSAATTRRRQPGPGDPTGTAWNMGVLREALGDRVIREEAPAAETTQLHGLRELFGDDVAEDAASPSSVVAEMGLGSNSSSGAARPSLDHILQGMLTLRTVLSTAAVPAEPSEALERHAELEREREMSFEDVDAPLSTPLSSSPPTRRGRRRFFVGQWLDVKDTVNQWLECTVMAVSADKVLVHYHGWPSRWDEWIDFDSDRIAAFRTRTLHTVTSSHLSPTPATRLPNAPSVGGHDVREMVTALRDLMRELAPHVERFADLCEHPQQLPHRIDFFDDADASDEGAAPAAAASAASHAAELSEMAHFMAPLFDRFGRVLADSAHCLEPLLAPELRSYTRERQAQQARAAAVRGRSARQPASVPSALEARDTSLGVRDLISSALRPPPGSQQPVQRNIDVHIHAILAPSSLQSFASLARAVSNGSETATRRLRAPQTPPVAGPAFDEAFGLPSLREPLGGSDGRALVTDEADDSDQSDRASEDQNDRRPLLSSFRRRHESRAASSTRRRRTVGQNLDSFLADDFFGTSFGSDSDEHGDSAAPANSRSPTQTTSSSSPSFAYRTVASPSARDELRDEDDVASEPVGTLGVIPEVAEAEARARARARERGAGVRVRTASEERVRGDSSASSSSISSASSAASSGASYPSFLEFMRRSLRRNFGFTPQQREESEGGDEELPALEAVPSSPSSSSLSTPPSANSSVLTSSSARRASSSSSSSSVEEDEEMDQVD